MEKKTYAYVPYKDGVWNTETLERIKKETGFDPGEQEDGVNVTDKEFVKQFLQRKNIPDMKLVNIDGDRQNLVVRVTEFILEEGEEEENNADEN